MKGQCDCCGEDGELAGPLIVCGIETYACAKCRHVDEEDDDALHEWEHSKKEFPTS